MEQVPLQALGLQWHWPLSCQQQQPGYPDTTAARATQHSSAETGNYGLTCAHSATLLKVPAVLHSQSAGHAHIHTHKHSSLDVTTAWKMWSKGLCLTRASIRTVRWQVPVQWFTSVTGRTLDVKTTLTLTLRTQQRHKLFVPMLPGANPAEETGTGQLTSGGCATFCTEPAGWQVPAATQQQQQEPESCVNTNYTSNNKPSKLSGKKRTWRPIITAGPGGTHGYVLFMLGHGSIGVRARNDSDSVSLKPVVICLLNEVPCKNNNKT